MEHRQRKRIRLQNYDYTQNGAYFVTICTQNREMLFGDICTDGRIVGADSISARMIDDIFQKTMAQYEHISCPNYVIMPNHFHAIIVIENSLRYTDMKSWADMESAPTRVSLSDVVQSFKRHTTVEYIRMVKQGIVPSFDKKIWQRSFYEHIIRNEQEYQKISDYINNNPMNWKNDCFYSSIAGT